MSKYTFTSDFVPDQLDGCNRSTKITHEFEADTIEEMCSQFEYFLRGAGFHFDGRLDIVEDYPVNKDVEEKERTDYHTDAPLDIPVPANTEVKGKFYVDPPTGWKYGFPAAYDEKKDGTLQKFLLAKGYPKKDIKWAVENCRMWHENETE